MRNLKLLNFNQDIPETANIRLQMTLNKLALKLIVESKYINRIK